MMPTSAPPPDLQDFAAIIRHNEPLAPYTYLKVGGPAELLVQPKTREELAAVVRICRQKNVPLRVLGGGCKVLVRDQGVSGVVLRLSEPAFTSIAIEGRRVRAGAGAPLSALISEAALHGLSGPETLVGIPGTVGGAVRCNAGDRSGEVGQLIRAVEVVDGQGQIQLRDRDDLRFAADWSNLDEPVLLTAEFELEPDRPDAIVKRMRKAWIHRKAGQPLSFQAAGRIFKNPRGYSAAALIEQAGLARTKVGGAEISERDPNCIMAHPGASARDVLRLIDLIHSRVHERFNVDLELDIAIW
jgi:UDP-N-acetylmuramate dehydrogenase